MIRTAARASRKISRRAFLLTACALAGASVSLGACASGTFPFIPDHYTFSARQIEAAVQRKFPYRRLVLQMFELVLDNPVVTLLPGRNRVAIQLDAHVSSPLLRQPVNGRFTLSGTPAWDGASRSVVLHNPSVDSVSIDGPAAVYAGQIAEAGTLAAAQLPVYTFKPGQLQFAGVNYEPGEITVLPDGIRVQIVEK